MYIFLRYAIDEEGTFLDAPMGTWYEADIDDDFADFVAGDFDHISGMYNEVRRQGRSFCIDNIEDKELKEEAESFWYLYEARVYEL